MLYILATPIGNLEDITLRALRILREVDFIICEDTRVTAKLLAHYEIKKPLISYHHHSKLDKINYIIEKLAKGESAALVSDAGTPGISDPGGILIREVETRLIASASVKNAINKIQIIPIPGPCAAITLASVSGIAMDKFLFMGFPPHKNGRKTFFEKVLASEYPVIFYESCHRILKALGDLYSPLFQRGDRGDFSKAGTDNLGNVVNIIVGRELTKMFETIYRGNAEEVMRELERDKNNLKGEFTVIVFHKKKNKPLMSRVQIKGFLSFKKGNYQYQHPSLISCEEYC